MAGAKLTPKLLVNEELGGAAAFRSKLQFVVVFSCGWLMQDDRMLAIRLTLPGSGVAVTTTAGLMLPPPAFSVVEVTAVPAEGFATGTFAKARRAIVAGSWLTMVDCWPVPSATMASLVGLKNCWTAAIVATVVTSVILTWFEAVSWLQVP